MSLAAFERMNFQRATRRRLRRNTMFRIFALLSFAAALLLAAQNGRTPEHAAASDWSRRQVVSAAMQIAGCGAAEHGCHKGAWGDPCCSHDCCSSPIALGSHTATAGIAKGGTVGLNLADRSLRSAALARDPPTPVLGSDRSIDHGSALRRRR
jgi:hypothetical protein